MGIDVVDGDSFSWASWHFLYEVGLAFGWTPLGTSKPSFRDDSGEMDIFSWDEARNGPWSGNYFFNDGQVVTAEDADFWRRAVTRALACMRGEASPENDEQRKIIETYGDRPEALFRRFLNMDCDEMILL